MREQLIHIFPWVLSAETIVMMYMTGNKNKNGWLLGIFLQILWFIYIFIAKVWGFLPITIAMCGITIRNYYLWDKEDGEQKR